MQAWTEWTPSSRTRRWKRRKKSNAVARAWTWVISLTLAAAVIGFGAWEVRQNLNTSVANGNSMGEAAMSMLRGQVLAPWQQDVLDSLDTSASQVGSGQVSEAEIAVDRAAGILTAARLKSQHSDNSFFQMAVTGLDRVWSQRPTNDRLFEHVTKARIELAMLRAAQNVAPADSLHAAVAAASGSDPDAIPAVHADGGSTAPAAAFAAAAAAKSPVARGHVSIAGPREVSANSLLNPGALGGDYLDATRLAATAEIVVPPARRSLEDNVAVEKLTIAGASQTLDGIRWTDVTFVGTRVKYAKGQLDMENVRFVNCTFDFPADAGGSRLSNAIALGQTSFTAE